MNDIIQKSQQFPNSPGIYIFKDVRKVILYVGKAKDLKKRIGQYFRPGSVWKQDMLNNATDLEFIETKTGLDAFYLEENLIKEHQPFYNRLLKRNTNYAYIKITNEKIPQIFITRKKVNDGATYIGPKNNTKILHKFMNYLLTFYGWRTCKTSEFHKHKLCFKYDFGICKGRCQK